MAGKVMVHDEYKDFKIAIKEGELKARANNMQWVVLEKSKKKQVFKIMPYKEYMILLKSNKNIENIRFVCKAKKRSNPFNKN